MQSIEIVERIKALRLMDDEFMSVVFDGDNELTTLVLRIILNRDDLTVKKTMILPLSLKRISFLSLKMIFII